MKSLTIGQLARNGGVGVETVRFYERKGLLAEPDRRPSGYRQYDEDVVDRLRFIKRAKELGFNETCRTEFDRCYCNWFAGSVCLGD